MQILPDPIAALVLTLPFLVTLAGLWFILFKPLLAYMEERDAVSARALAEADHLNHQAEARLSEIDARLATARKESADHRQAHRAVAQKQEVAIIRQARSAADARVDAAVERIGGERQAASGILRGQATELGNEVARQVLGREV
jgi:F0F1-type ATP synthase membrane subunit b/b'